MSRSKTVLIVLLVAGVAVILGDPALRSHSCAATIGVVTSADDLGGAGPDASPAPESSTTGSLYQNATTWFNDTGAKAAASIDGSLAVSAYTGGNDHNYFVATSSWLGTFTNSGTEDRAYSFEFHVANGTISLADTVNHFGDVSAGSYRIEILLNGATIWNSSTTVIGQIGLSDTGSDYSDARFITDGVDLGGTASTWESSSFLAFGASYSFPEYSGSVSLGSYGPGSMFTLEYILSIGVQGGEASSNYACLGDPSNLGASPGMSGAMTSTAPEPSTMVLVGTGLVGLATYGRKRMRK